MIEDTMFDNDCYAVFMEEEHEKEKRVRDNISRQEALDILDDFQSNIELGIDDYAEKRKALCDFPSAEPQWIPCSERLPEPNRHDELNVDVYYLAQTEFGDMIVASYNESHEGTKWWELIYSYRIFDDEIVAWMPLPEPYKGGENE